MYNKDRKLGHSPKAWIIQVFTVMESLKRNMYICYKDKPAVFPI